MRIVAASQRMLALALVLEGVSRTKVARTAGMDRQTSEKDQRPGPALRPEPSASCQAAKLDHL